jgi:DNA-binding response OmpR family regulator
MGGLMDSDQHVEPLRILVVEHRQFERKLIAETLRATRDLVIEYAESAEQCLNVLAEFRPDLLIADWDLDGGKGLDLVRRIRRGDGERRATPVVMVTTRNTAADVEAARNAGVDEFVLRPFSTAILTRRAHTVRETKRDFVESADYVGPCRRKREIKDYDGPRRRTIDAREQPDDTPDLQIRKGLACMYVERIGVLLRALKPHDPEGIRELCLACAQLRALAQDMSDRMLTSAAASLFEYLKGCGVRRKLDTGVVQAHLDALLQLAQLPNFQIELRHTVTQQLKVMVAKKLRQANAAA